MQYYINLIDHDFIVTCELRRSMFQQYHPCGNAASQLQILLYPLMTKSAIIFVITLRFCDNLLEVGEGRML